MSNKELNVVEQAAEVVDAYLPEAKARLTRMGVPADHEQYQALVGMTHGVKHTEPEYPEKTEENFLEETQPMEPVSLYFPNSPFGDDSMPGF